MKNHTLRAIALTVPFCFSVDAFAQTAAQNDEIVVTALKREQRLSEVPGAISALSSQDLETRGIEDLNDIQIQTPSLNFGNSLGTAQVSIRGVGLTIDTGAGEPGVALHLDGVYEARPAIAALSQFDLERVEVLRGPQGTLYGRNATGGAINFISKAPTDEFEGKASIGYAEYNELLAELALSGPLIDGVKGRLAIQYRDRSEGFIENIAPGQRDLGETQDVGARGRLAFDLSANASLDLQLTYVDTNGSTVAFDDIAAPNPFIAAVNPSLQTALFDASAERTAVTSPRLSRTAYLPAATLTWDIGDVRLKAISAYTAINSSSGTDSDGTSAPIAYLPASYRSREFTQELNLSSSFSKLDWLVGGYYLHEDYDATQDVLFPVGWNAPVPLPGGGLLAFPIFVPNDAVIQHWSEKRESFAAFFDGTLNLTDRLSLFGGGRYSNDTFELTQSVQPGLSSGFLCTNLTNEVSFEAFTPRLGVKFAANDRQNVFASVSRGYKGGGLNFGSCNDPYDPEEVTSYEAGYKGQLIDNRLSLELTAFQYDYKDLQVYQLRPIAQGGGSFIDNAPKATIRGIEGSAVWDATENFQVNVSAAYNKAEYDEYSNVDSSDPTGTLQNLSGNTLSRAPEVTASLGLQYTTPTIAGVGTFTIRGEVYHSSKVYFSEFNTVAESQGSYEVVNAFVVWKDEGERYSARLYARNLLDEQYYNFLTPSPLTGTQIVTWAAPRQIGIELGVNF